MARRRATGSLPAVSPAARHALLFAAQFFAFGVVLPFLPAVLADGGLSPEEVGLVLAAGAAVRLVAGPLGGRLADALGRPPLVLAACAALSALAAAGYLVAAGLGAMLLVHVLLSAAMAPIVPLSDALAVAAARRHDFDYGRSRAAGSVAFILGSLAAGQAVAAAGTGAAVWLISAGLLASAGAALLLPRAAEAPTGRPGLAGLLGPLRLPALRWLLPVSALIQGSHALYYGFGTLHWQAAGLSPAVIGALWATGVVAEVALFVWGRGVVARLGPVGLCLVAAGAGAFRWGATALTTDPLLLFPLQVLHAASFAAQHLAAMAVLGRAVPANEAATAQTLHAALGVGAAMGLLTLGCGPLYAWAGGGAFWAMAGLCVLAVPAVLGLRGALRARPSPAGR